MRHSFKRRDLSKIGKTEFMNAKEGCVWLYDGTIRYNCENLKKEEK